MLTLFCKFLSDEDKKPIFEQAELQKGKHRWEKAYWENFAFLAEYSSMKYDANPKMMKKRSKAYAKQYDIPEATNIQYGVQIIREHYGWGKLKVGEKVLFARNVDIDITGGLTIGDNVGISEGVSILTHAHDFYGMVKDKSKYLCDANAYATPLKIGNNVIIGKGTTIMPGVTEIGENSIIGANSVVTKKIPANSQVQGNPAKVIADLYRFRVYYRGEHNVEEAE